MKQVILKSNLLTESRVEPSDYDSAVTAELIAALWTVKMTCWIT